jgi:hypothetical protein
MSGDHFKPLVHARSFETPTPVNELNGLNVGHFSHDTNIQKEANKPGNAKRKKK